MPLIAKPNYNQIFASQAPEQDKPAVFNNYPGGWGVESRPNNGKPTIKGFNYLQQTSDLKDLWILQNGACLPYDESIEYAEGAPVLKDGVIQYKTAGGFKSRDAVSIPTYNNAADGVDPLIGVADGAYFNVRSSSDESYIDEYQNVGGSAVATGKSYPSGSYVETIAEYTPLPFKQGKSYALYERVQLSNGDVVKSTVSNNTVNPNVDMTGWVNTGDTSQIFDSESGLDQKVLNSIFKSTKYMDVRYFGIYSGLSTDLGALINTADAAARSLGCGLYFPAGTYLATGLLPTVSLSGDGKGKTIIKNHGTNVNTGFCLIKNVSIFCSYDGITFDGSVSADPVAWSSANYNSFTGAIPLVIDNSSKIILGNIECKNAKMSDLRITSSTDVFLFDVDTEKARGNFGDGIYIGLNSKRIFGDRVNIKDVTRIGIVFEGGTTHCRFRNLNIENAHDGSNAYSGTEFNGGVWAENASHIYIDVADTKNTRDYGFLMTTGAGLSGIDQAYFELRNCNSEGASTGFLNRSKPGSIPASHKLFNCKAKSYMPFLCNPRYDDDTFEYYNCDAFITGSVPTMSPIHAALFFQYDVSFTNKRSKVTVRDFTIGRDIPLTDYSDTAKYDCDIAFYTGNYFDLLLDNISTLDGSPVYIKNRLNAATNDKTRIRESKVDFKGFRTTDLKTTDCELSGTINNSTGKSRFNNTEIKTKLSLTSYDFRFNDLDCDFALAADFLELISTNDTLDLVGKINNAKFKKDISAGDYSLKYQSGNNANKAKLLVSNSEFYSSSGATTAANSHVWIVRNPSSVIYQNILRDDFAPMQKVASTITSVEPIGVTAITLH